MYVCMQAGVIPSESDLARNKTSLEEIKELFPKHEAVRIGCGTLCSAFIHTYTHMQCYSVSICCSSIIFM